MTSFHFGFYMHLFLQTFIYLFILQFGTTMSELESRTLWVSVWHSDMFGRNDFLGEVVITLADTVFDDVSPKWYPLQDRVSASPKILSWQVGQHTLLPLTFPTPKDD